jgi:hypothetical protein
MENIMNNKLVNKSTLLGALSLAMISVGGQAFAQQMNMGAEKIQVPSEVQIKGVLSYLEQSGHIRKIGENQFMLSDQLENVLSKDGGLKPKATIKIDLNSARVGTGSAARCM